MSACPIRDKDSRILVRKRKQRDSDDGERGRGILEVGVMMMVSAVVLHGRERGYTHIIRI